MARLIGRIKYQITHRKLVKAMQAAAWELVNDVDVDEKTKEVNLEVLQLGIENKKRRKKRVMKYGIGTVVCVAVGYIVYQIYVW